MASTRAILLFWFQFRDTDETRNRVIASSRLLGKIKTEGARKD